MKNTILLKRINHCQSLHNEARLLTLQRMCGRFFVKKNACVDAEFKPFGRSHTASLICKNVFGLLSLVFKKQALLFVNPSQGSGSYQADIGLGQEDLLSLDCLHSWLGRMNSLRRTTCSCHTLPETTCQFHKDKEELD